MKKNIQINVCDVCKTTSDNIKEKIATRKCAVCERDMCASSEHDGDDYRTTQHMRKSFSDKNPMQYFVCSECWELSEYFGYKSNTTRLPTGDIDLRASGSSTAINMAEFREWIESEAKRISEEYLISLLKAVREGKQVKVELGKLEEKMRSETKKKQDDLLLQKKKELLETN